MRLRKEPLAPTGKVAGLDRLAKRKILSCHESSDGNRVILTKLSALQTPFIHIMKLQNQDNWPQVAVK
jgi:hypothetical protein